MDDEQPDYADAEREGAILRLLEDKASTSQLLLALEQKVAITLPSVKLVIAQYREQTNSFPTAFLSWIGLQCQPFVTYRAQNLGDSHPNDSSTSNAAVSDSLHPPAALSSAPISAAGSQKQTSTPGAATTASTVAKPTPKAKKRVTPNAVSSTDGSALLGNIASTPSTADIAGPAGLFSSAMSPSASNSFNSAMVSPFEAGRHAAVSPVITLSKVMGAPSAGSQSLNRSISGDAAANRESATKSVNSDRCTRGLSIPKASDVMKRSAPYSVRLVTSAANTHTGTEAVARMSAVLTSLIINQHIYFAHALPLLAKLCSLSLPGPREGMQVVVTVLEPERFPTLLLSSELFHLFAVETMKAFSPVLRLLGDRVALGFAESPVLSRFSPALSAELTGASEDARGASMAEDISFSLPDNFVRPFREETDSRNEYKSQTEAAAYNERERCFDDFSNLLHSFQLTNRSDVDGSKTLSFWRTVLPVAGAKIMALRDCNYSWFATIFVQMLLFHGLNAPSGSSRPLNSRDEGPSPLHSSSAEDIGSNKNGNCVPVSNFGGKIDGIANNFDVNKQRKLEIRMGPGGNGTLNGARRPQPSRGAKQPPHTAAASRVSPALADIYEDPALHFSGNQQFFFRFIVLMDNHRFCRCLEDAVAKEISALCGKLQTSVRRRGDSVTRRGVDTPTGSRTRATSFTSEGDDTATSSSSSSSFLKCPSRDGNLDALEHFNTQETYASSVQSFALRTVKLRLLGKFLGLLTFWPQWLLTVTPGESGPLALLAASAARTRGALRPATAYPIRTILEQAWLSNRLAYTVPWVAEFLKMTVWDCTYSELYNPYRDVFGLLSSMQRSELLHPIKGKPSSNRLYVLIEIQNLWIALSLSDIESTPLPAAKGKNPKSYYEAEEIIKIDDQNTAFSLSFLHHVTTFLNETVNVFKKRLQLNLAKRSPMPFSVSTGRSLLPSSVSSAGSVAFSTTKRQTPNFVGTLSSTGAPPPPGPFSGLLLSPQGGSRDSRFSSPSSKAAVSAIQPVSSKGGDMDEEILGQEILGPNGIVATSLMAQFSATVAVRRQKSVAGVTGHPDRKKEGGEVSPVSSQLLDLRMLMTTEAMQSRSPLPPPSTSSAPSAPPSLSLSAGKAPRTRSSSAITPLASRSSQAGSSPLRSSTGTPTPLSAEGALLTPSTAASQHDSSSLNDRLEFAFWQQHPPLQHISGFLLEHLQQACLAHLKDRVAESVRTLWSRFASLRAENKQLIDAEHLSAVGLSEEGKYLTGIQVADIVSMFPARLEAEKELIQASTVTAARAFLESFMETHISVAVPELCALHPCHARVTSLAVWLIRKQASAQRGALMSFLSSYSRRKLGEVSSLSAKQFKKSMDGLSLHLRPEFRNGEEGESNASSPLPSPVMRVDGGHTSDNFGMNNAKSTRRSTQGRREELSCCFPELNLFFESLQGPLDVDVFTSGAISMQCKCIEKQPFRAQNGTLTTRDSFFHNRIARMCEAMHALVEALAACTGDRVAEELAADCIDAACDTPSYPALTASRPSSYVSASSSLPVPPVVPPKAPPSWGPMGSAKLISDMQIKSNQAKPVPKPPLTSAQVITAIENTRVMFIALLHMAGGEGSGVAGFLLKGSEAAGKLSIQIVKLMTSCMPSLFYFDAFLAEGNRRDRVTSPSADPFSVSRLVPQDPSSASDVTTEWDRFLFTTRSSVHLRSHQHPSDVLAAAEALGVISAESLSFVVTATARPSTLAYYTACMDLPVLKERVPGAIRSFLGRCYLTHYLQSRESRDSGTAHTADIAMRVFQGLCGSVDWLEVPAVRAAVEDELHPDLRIVIAKLKKG